ncbi:MAG TPA: SRPBCC family protein [Polyangiaceae bacterium]
MDDVTKLIGAVTREVKSSVRDGKDVKAVVVSRFYDTDLEDAWDALTSAERLARWFTPIEGELRLGGRYQFKGNAGGTITHCDPPRALRVTWEFGGGMSWVEVELAPERAGTRLTLVHIVPIDEHFDQYGPGAVGVGWDLGLLGLDLHLRDRSNTTPAQGDVWAESDDGKRFSRLAAEDWARAAIANGADPASAHEVAARTAAFYTGSA